MKYACEYALIIIEISDKNIRNMHELKNIYSCKFNSHNGNLLKFKCNKLIKNCIYAFNFNNL